MWPDTQWVFNHRDEHLTKLSYWHPVSFYHREHLIKLSYWHPVSFNHFYQNYHDGKGDKMVIWWQIIIILWSVMIIDPCHMTDPFYDPLWSLIHVIWCIIIIFWSVMIIDLCQEDDMSLSSSRWPCLHWWALFVIFVCYFFICYYYYFLLLLLLFLLLFLFLLSSLVRRNNQLLTHVGRALRDSLEILLKTLRILFRCNLKEESLGLFIKNL